MAEAEAQLAKVDEALATVASQAALNAPRSNVGGDSWLRAGEVAFWLGDTARAIRLLSKEYVKLPRHNLLLGQAYERERNLAEARASYTRVVESTGLDRACLGPPDRAGEAGGDRPVTDVRLPDEADHHAVRRCRLSMSVRSLPASWWVLGT